VVELEPHAAAPAASAAIPSATVTLRLSMGGSLLPVGGTSVDV
jgi:hypothetical protein